MPLLASRALLASCLLGAVALVTGGCSGNAGGGGGGALGPGVIAAVAAENQYGNVLAQIGGRYVSVSSVLDNPDTDPHSFESSPAVAEEVAAASLVVQNGAGYDTFMNSIEQASPSSSRKVIVVQQVVGIAGSSSNPHLWYDPRTMSAVAKVMADDLASIAPAHAAYFRANLRAFDTSLQPFLDAVASFRASHRGVTVATTEPVADYLLAAMGIDDLTPARFQADVMNGVDPAPEDVTLVRSLLSGHKVKVFCYNQQVVSPLTSSIRAAAEADGVPVVAVYETMPVPGYDYQTWMLAEVQAIEKAVEAGASTQQL